jgi:hypothetical protein
VNDQAAVEPTTTLMKSRRRIAFSKAQDSPIYDDCNYSRDLRPAKWGSEIKLRSNNSEPLMSALGQKQTLPSHFRISALLLKADMHQDRCDVCFVPMDSGQLATAPIIQPAIPDQPLRAPNSE